MSRRELGLLVLIVGCTAAPRPASEPLAPGSGAARDAAAAPTPTSSLTPPTPSSRPPAASSPDDERCHGSIDAALQDELSARAAQVRICYERLLRRDPRREGRMMVTVKLSAPAVIEQTWITLDELADPETTQCARATFQEPLNGTVAGDCAIVNVPLRFEIKKPEAPAQEDAGPSE